MRPFYERMSYSDPPLVTKALLIIAANTIPVISERDEILPPGAPADLIDLLQMPS